MDISIGDVRATSSVILRGAEDELLSLHACLSAGIDAIRERKTPPRGYSEQLCGDVADKIQKAIEKLRAVNNAAAKAAAEKDTENLKVIPGANLNWGSTEPMIH